MPEKNENNDRLVHCI